LNDGDQLELGALHFNVLHTPGHSPGGQCFLCENHLIAGDTLFIDGCGRCDLTGSDVEAMYHSIHGKLMALPDDTIIYPGHNYGPTPTDTLGNQKRTNRFLRATGKDDFIRERMG
jgi:glyoxylase-like metal-dependent hydrolase (beta-lactamase superfamily II)